MNCELKRLLSLFFLLILLLAPPAFAADERIEPAWPVPDYVEHLLQVASEEIGYTEDHGRTKYGTWAGDPAAQWCAEFLCWCVDQVDQRWNTSLLRNVYPFYTSSNTGLRWFLRAGRYVVRKGKVEGWGYQWLKGQSSFIRSGDYVPQPGDWVFFNWSGGTDTQHVAMVEYCSRDLNTAKISVHVIEGNNPDSVKRNIYELNSLSIMGYGTVHDVADITMSFGNQGEKVRILQERLSYLGYLNSENISGRFGDSTAEGLRAWQSDHGLTANGIANMKTQQLLEEEYTTRYANDPGVWSVVDDE